MLLRILSTLLLCYPLNYAKPLSWGALEGIFQRLFLFFCLCLLSNVCLSPLIIYPISTSYVLFSVSMLIFIFVVWALLGLSYIFKFLLVHYTELRLRLLYQFTSYNTIITPFTCPNAFANELVICSLNVRGLSNPMERREIFRWLKTKNYAIFFLQEVHCSKDNEICWTSEWGYSAIFISLFLVISLSRASAGVSRL